MLGTFWCSLFKYHHLFLSFHCRPEGYSDLSPRGSWGLHSIAVLILGLLHLLLRDIKTTPEPTEVWQVICCHAVKRKFTYIREQHMRIHKTERENRPLNGKPNALKGKQHSLNTVNDLQNEIEFNSECVWNTEEKKMIYYERNDFKYYILKSIGNWGKKLDHCLQEITMSRD